MKQFYILIILLSFFTSCSISEIELNENHFCTSKINLAGDYVDIASCPLTKGGEKKYYAFEVDSLLIDVSYSKYRDPLYDTTYIHYAGGIFEDIKNVNITLEKGHQYRIRCSIIEEREDHLFVENNYVYAPFVDSSGDKVEINNFFIYGGEKDVFAYSTVGYINTEEKEFNFAAKVNRYYGEVIADVSEGIADITINMKRRNFGLHFIINPPKEGILKVSNTYSDPEFTYELNSASSSIDVEYVYALGLINDSNIIKLDILWTRADNSIVDLSVGKVKLYNKTMTTLKVDVNDRIGSTDLDINYDSEMDNEEITIK